MRDIPQPSSNPYDPGDIVRVYPDLDDPDSRFHGVRCEVVGRFADDLDRETGRDSNQFTYRVRTIEAAQRNDIAACSLYSGVSG